MLKKSFIPVNVYKMLVSVNIFPSHRAMIIPRRGFTLWENKYFSKHRIEEYRDQRNQSTKSRYKWNRGESKQNTQNTGIHRIEEYTKQRIHRTEEQAGGELCQAKYRPELATTSSVPSSWGYLFSQLWLELEAWVSCSLDRGEGCRSQLPK